MHNKISIFSEKIFLLHMYQSLVTMKFNERPIWNHLHRWNLMLVCQIFGFLSLRFHLWLLGKSLFEFEEACLHLEKSFTGYSFSCVLVLSIILNTHTYKSLVSAKNKASLGIHSFFYSIDGSLLPKLLFQIVWKMNILKKFKKVTCVYAQCIGVWLLGQ